MRFPNGKLHLTMNLMNLDILGKGVETLMENTKLTLRQRLLVAATLFGMFFGAGNLIFPVHLGQLAGRNLLPAMIGFIITAVGIPILGVAAIGNTHSDGLQMLSNKVGKTYGYFFTCILYLTIGPFFAIPRCATTSFTTGITPIIADKIPEAPALFVFSLIFFILVLFFSIRPGNITLWIGKIINPLFLCFLAILVFSALLHPSISISAAEPDAAYHSGAFFHALSEGYGTMDAIAGLAFGIVVVTVIRQMGISEDSAVAKEVLHSGILAGLLMAVIYILTILMGAQSLGLFAVSENGGIALAQISSHYLGRAGMFILAITITFACLKTSIGLVTSCAETFVKMFPDKLSYNSWAILFTIFSFVISNVGLSTIIRYSIPILMLIYPPAITLILLALCGKLFHHDRSIYICVTAFTWAASLFDFIKTLPEQLQTALHLTPLILFAENYLPLFRLNLGWVLPAILGLILGIILSRVSRKHKEFPV